ncbi:MAG TPA: DUF6452 family protein [Paludibacter sp.]|nr:DUF6452 family protein [Paludibacter sp.]
MKNFQYILFFLCLIAGFSCAVDESCRTNRSVLMDIGVYHVNKTDTSKTVTAMSIDTLTIKGLKFDSSAKKYIYVDSILYNKAQTVNKINLPLHSFESTSVFEATFTIRKITINPVTSKNDTTYITKNDTLTVLHQNTDKYLSLECGSIKIHSVDTILTTNNFIDSIRIINRKVNNINVENIQIYK